MKISEERFWKDFDCQILKAKIKLTLSGSHKNFRGIEFTKGGSLFKIIEADDTGFSEEELKDAVSWILPTLTPDEMRSIEIAEWPEEEEEQGPT